MKKARIFLVATFLMLSVAGVFATKHHFSGSTITNLYYLDNLNQALYIQINGLLWTDWFHLEYYTSGAPSSGQATISLLGDGPYGLYTNVSGNWYGVY